MNKYTLDKIGKIININGDFSIELEKRFIPALKGLDGFSHLQILYWCDKNDNKKAREKTIIEKPYGKGPELMGVFATRSPERPNPLALSCVYVKSIDYSKGIIKLAYIDAENDTPLIDIKPYTPSLDRVERPSVPHWCSHWPKCSENSGLFDWESEFNF